MTDDIVARLRNIAPEEDDQPLTRKLILEAADELERLREAAKGQLVVVNAAEARVRELEAENKRLAERLDLLAVGFGVPDGGRYIADWQTKIEKLKAAERALAEAYERAAKEAETCWVTYTGRAGDDEREQIDRARQDIATALRAAGAGGEA